MNFCNFSFKSFIALLIFINNRISDFASHETLFARIYLTQEYNSNENINLKKKIIILIRLALRIYIFQGLWNIFYVNLRYIFFSDSTF